ncbi:MAG: Ig-like domain-containing protein, partial [Roseiflexus sp.]|nr:Ig-like domain-containing protein [Roseiflexus sp.]
MSVGAFRRLLRILALTTTILVLCGVPTARSAPTSFVTANNIVLQQGQTLPVFQLTAPSVTGATTQALAQRLSGIGDRSAVQDEYLGRIRFTVPNTDTRSLLTRYSASGGFYAFNLNDLGRETPRGPIDRNQAARLACRFLIDNGFMDSNGYLLRETQQEQGIITLDPQKCGRPPDYRTRLIKAASISASAPEAAATEQVVGVVVEVPMAIPLPPGSASSALPLGGPGGHLSLMFTATAPDNGFSLDDAVPGLTAVAMPFFSRELTRIRDVPIQDPNALRDQVRQQVRAAYPDASSISVPDPSLVYYVSDAVVEQRVLEPVLEFNGIEVTIGGETFVLRSITLPLLKSGSGGFGPSVRIIAPSSGSRFAPGSNVTLRGEVRDGAAPYRVEWLNGEGDTIQATILNSPGEVAVTTNSLPAENRDGMPGPTTVTLRVTDNQGAVRQDRITLIPFNTLFLPLITRSGTSAAVHSASERIAEVPAAPQSTEYSFGVVWVSDYPAGISDLPGVIPDV